MRTGTNKDNLIAQILPDQQPIRRNVTLPEAVPLPRQFVRTMAGVQPGGAADQVDGGPEPGQGKTPLGGELQVALELFLEPDRPHQP